jgi:hypothetical protein
MTGEVVEMTTRLQRAYKEAKSGLKPDQIATY